MFKDITADTVTTSPIEAPGIEENTESKLSMATTFSEDETTAYQPSKQPYGGGGKFTVRTQKTNEI